MPFSVGLSHKILIKNTCICGHNMTKCGKVQGVQILLQATVCNYLNETVASPGIVSVVNHPCDCVKALPLVWDVEGFKDMREGGIVTTDPGDGSLQVEETLFLQQRTEGHFHLPFSERLSF